MKKPSPKAARKSASKKPFRHPSGLTADELRRCRGEAQWCHRLTELQVLQMRERFAADPTLSYNDLALEYGVTKFTIRAVLLRQSWRHI